MSNGITKTIPAKVGEKTLNLLYDGIVGEFEFHMAGKPSKLKVGDYVYTIFANQMIGRLKIKQLVGGAINPASGKPRTLIIVEVPGERFPKPIPRESHRGTRYYDGADWPTS